MIVLDTHALIFDALSPERLSKDASEAIEQGARAGNLACSDISLWETAMLIASGRLDPAMETERFLEDLVNARGVRVLPITAAIATLARSSRFPHGDPADRLIASTALCHQAALVTADQHLQKVVGLQVIW